MSISIKTPEEIEMMSQGGKILAEVMEELKKAAKPGVTTLSLDSLAEDLIKKAGGQSSFKTVSGYSWTTCLGVNEVVVHGIPDDYKLKEGDILGIDMGAVYKGFHTDMSETIIIGSNLTNISNLTNFLKVGQRALEEAIKQAKPGNRIGHISQVIDKMISNAGYAPVKSLVGHGVGRALHEDPHIPIYFKGNPLETPLIEAGMTLAIEVIYNQGGPELVYKNDDGWTIQTADNTLSGLFEKTIAINADGPEILT